MKILISIATHPLYGIRPQAQASFNALDMTGHHVDIVKIIDDGIDSRLLPFDQLVQKHHKMASIAIDGKYDAVLSLEFDNVIPPDTLHRLVAIDADVSHGLYCNRRYPYLWLANIETTTARGITYARNSATVSRAWGNVVQTQGVGLGCTLIHRHVIESIPFRREPNHPCADDWFFALDCIKAGYKLAHDCGCIVGHILDDGNRIVWPAREEPFYMIEGEMLTAQQIQTESGQGKYICVNRLFIRAENAYYQPGEVVFLTDEQATGLLASGSIIRQPPVAEPALFPAPESTMESVGIVEERASARRK